VVSTLVYIRSGTAATGRSLSAWLVNVAQIAVPILNMTVG